MPALAGFAITALLLATDARRGTSAAPTGELRDAGDARLYQDGDSSFARWVHARECALHLSRYERMRLYSPYADGCIRGGYRGGLNYHDAQAIYPAELRPRRRDSQRTRDSRRRLARWILRDSRGRRLFVPFDCRRGRCPQYAADIGNPGFRARVIDEIRRVMRRGYSGVFLDDVNWNLNVGDGSGRPVTPIDPRTKRPMQLDDWRRHMADFVEEVRAATSGKELMINPVWWRPESSLEDPNVRRGVAAADVYEYERGTDDLFHGQSFDALLATTDRLHELGLGVNLDNYRATTRERAEFELAFYYLISTGRDSFSADYGSCPDNHAGSPCEEPFWSGYKTSLGAPLAGRETRPDLLLQRRFERGLVLVNPPGAPRRTAMLDGTYRDLDGGLRTWATIDGGQALVLSR